MKASDAASLLEHLTDEEREELLTLLAKDQSVWLPQPGPQSEAYHSQADILGYGGAAGGGKTDLACGLALTAHSKSMILRRVGTELTQIEDRLEKLIGNRDGYNSQKHIWRTKRRADNEPLQIELGSVQHPGDETAFQGRPHDLLVFDEATRFLPQQVRFLMGWLRSENPRQRCRVVLTFNPPTDSDGRWVIDFFGPWLDKSHPNPAKPGELRWYAAIDGADVEVKDGTPFVVVDGLPCYDFDPSKYQPSEIIRPLSRTFIPSRLTDNPFYGAEYMATLQGLPEPLRSQMLNGDFGAGMEDDQWQVIPTAWVEAAQARWTDRTAKGPMDSMGVDVARGGRDETIIARRHGTWFDNLICLPGTETPDGPTVAAQVIARRRDRAPVHIDVVGWGSSPYDFLVKNNIQAVPCNGANKATGRTADNAMGFANKRAEDWWRLREALDPQNPNPISLPPDPGLKSDLCAARWKPMGERIQVEPKADIIRRIGRSPDRGDAIVLANRKTTKTGANRDTAARSHSFNQPGGWML